MAPLRPFVSLIWTTDGTPRTPPNAQRELVLPSGAMHIVLRLGDSPLRVFSGVEDCVGHTASTSVIGGVRAAAYCKDTSQSVSMVGVMLQPGACDPFSRTPAGALANRHTCLEDVWRRCELAELRDRLETALSPADRLLVLEDMLTRYLPAVRGIDPLIAKALLRFDRGGAVGDVVVESGVSHRHLAQTFATAVGLSPKAYCRLTRFNRTLNRLHAAPDAALSDVSASEGYADQAHMTREFRAIAGVTPGRYRRASPVFARHVPISSSGLATSAVRFVQDCAHSPERD